jgi:hypothetical protein
MSEKTSKARTEPPPFPPVIYLNQRGYNWRSHLEHYKTQLVRHALVVRVKRLRPSTLRQAIEMTHAVTDSSV